MLYNDSRSLGQMVVWGQRRTELASRAGGTTTIKSKERDGGG